MDRVIKAFLLLAISGSALSQTLSPTQLKYRGAFRLPDYTPYEHGWYYGGSSMTYYPGGDPDGPADGYTGSLFGIGHAWNMYVAEVTIPVSVISQGRDLSDLNTAEFLQDFTDVRQDLFTDSQGNQLFYEIIRTGIEYLPPVGSQRSGKLHLSWGQHFQEDRQDPSHMWCELDLDSPAPRGPWYFSNYSNYITCDYQFEIPSDWSDIHLPGTRLACGRFRDGLWGGRGPALLAYRPFETDNPAADTITDINPLLVYGLQTDGDNHLVTDDSMQIKNFKEADEWIGGSWLQAGEASALVLAGTKGMGASWYGLPDGTVWDHDDPSMTDPLNQRGWWCDRFKSQLLFFSTDDLALVASGQKNPWQMQPCDSLDLDPFLFSIDSINQKHRLSSICYNREDNILFIMEFLADDDKPLVHVWQIESESTDVRSGKPPSFLLMQQNYPNPFNAGTVIQYQLQRQSDVVITIHTAGGQIIRRDTHSRLPAGHHTFHWDGKTESGTAVASGVYCCRIVSKGGGNSNAAVKKMVYLK